MDKHGAGPGVPSMEPLDGPGPPWYEVLGYTSFFKAVALNPSLLYAVFPGLVFIVKLQNDDLTMTSFVALRRQNDDHFKV